MNWGRAGHDREYLLLHCRAMLGPAKSCFQMLPQPHDRVHLGQLKSPQDLKESFLPQGSSLDPKLIAYRAWVTCLASLEELLVVTSRHLAVLSS